MTAYITHFIIFMLLFWQSSMAAAFGFSFLTRKFTPQILRSSRYTLNSHYYRKGSPIANTFLRAFSLQSPKMSKAFIQKPAPAFSGTAVNKYGEFIDIKLSDYTGKYLVLFFYPLDFTFVCPTEIMDFSKKAEEFRAINCELVACSVDSEYSHLAWTNVEPKKGGLGHINIPLLSDLTKQISKDYGVLLEDQGVALRGLFIIDDKGILRQITVNDLPVGRSADEVLRLVQAFQYTDKHGEVCPAGWRPGGDTIVPDTKKSADYFSKQ